MQKSRRFMFLLFGMLYFVQGVITSYQLNFFKPHMASAGIDADRIALVASLALLPFIIKLVYGLISDRFNLFGLGNRLPYMIIGVVLCGVAFFIAYFIDPGLNFGVLAGMVLLATFAMALFDTTADAFAIEVIPAEDYSRVQSFMAGGRAAGLIILSFVFGLLAERFGFSVIFLVIAATMILPLILLFQIRENKLQVKQQDFDWRAFRIMLRPSYLIFGGFLILAWFSFQGIDGLVTFYMSSELDASEVTLGSYGTIKGVGMVVGAISMSLIAARFGLRTAAITNLILISIGGMFFSFFTDLNLLLGFGAIWGIVVGLQWTVYAALAMGVTDLRIAGSMFAIFQTMANIGISAGEGVATSLSNNIGFAGVFRLLAGLSLLLIPLFLLAMRNFHERSLRTSQPART